jgi:hypothetical protein
MAARRYAEKRRSRRATVGRRRAVGVQVSPVAPAAVGEAARFVAVGTVASVSVPGCPAPLSFVVGGRYEVRVGAGFDGATLARLVRALEQL